MFDLFGKRKKAKAHEEELKAKLASKLTGYESDNTRSQFAEADFENDTRSSFDLDDSAPVIDDPWHQANPSDSGKNSSERRVSNRRKGDRCRPGR